MTNVEFAQSLRKLAELYETALAEMDKPILRIYVYDKPDLAKWLHAVGGMFKKTEPYIGADTLLFESRRIPEFGISIPRDKVCKKIVKWECEPLMSPDDHEEIDSQFVQAETAEVAE